MSDIQEVLNETGLDPRRLHLEITETAAMASPARTRQILWKVKDLGVAICLDDFGTGHSSLGRLRRFPVDVLKIDRSFVSQMDIDSEARQIARLIIEFAHTVNLQVIAEGVESSAQIEQLRSLACEFGQGYFFSKPVDHHAVQRLLTAGEQEKQASDSANARAQSAGGE